MPQQLRKLKLSKILLGIDEVGRGPWAGPLVVGAVILGEQSGAWIDELTDSKKLTIKKREELSPLILQNSQAHGLGWVSAAELDSIGLSRSLKLATRRAIKQILETKTPFDEIVIDGTNNFLVNTPLENRVTILKKADLLIKEVSAASIIAKVARDHYMIDLAKTYPEYGFENHVGYGTAAHKQALLKYGVTPEHRQSFRPIRDILKNCTTEIIREQVDSEYSPEVIKNADDLKTATDFGQKAEQIIASHLEDRGHQIIAHNFKTRTYEIDLISLLDDCIYFTEVKYRKSSIHGTAIMQVTPRKRQQMLFAAENFLTLHPEYRVYQPRLAVAGVSGIDFHIDAWFTLSE